jgi:hypothetical protein
MMITASIGTIAYQAVPDIPRLWVLACRLHELGKRPLFELLVEIVCGADPVERLERYARLDPYVVRKIKADCTPPRAAS